MPPISADTYTENVATCLVSSKPKSLDVASSSAIVRSSPTEERAAESHEVQYPVGGKDQTNCCLFCVKHSNSLETNVQHMSSEHSLYIPEIEHLSDLETLVRYLHTVITEYNECLYCGMMKHSAEGVRRHMLDKGHCMINLEREPQLLEFWDFSDGNEDDTDNQEISNLLAPGIETASSRDLSQDEHTLPSGKVVGSKSKAREARLLNRRTALALKENSNRVATQDSTDNIEITSAAGPVKARMTTPRDTQDRTVAVRDALGLAGVSGQQMRSLITVRRKMQRQQAIVRASAAWADEKGGTHQKHYKTKMNLRDG